jgi:hypothetical protein
VKEALPTEQIRPDLSPFATALGGLIAIATGLGVGRFVYTHSPADDRGLGGARPHDRRSAPRHRTHDRRIRCRPDRGPEWM